MSTHCCFRTNVCTTSILLFVFIILHHQVYSILIYTYNYVFQKRCTPLEIAELQGFREIIKILKEENWYSDTVIHETGLWLTVQTWNYVYDSRFGVLCCDLVPHDDVIKWKHFPRYRPFVREIHRSPLNSPHRGQWRGALLFSLIYALNKRLSK